MQVTSTLVGELTVDEVLERLDEILRKYEDLTPRGIRVSNSLHQRGISGEFRGVPIAMAPSLYPQDQIQVEFDDE
uniref:Uncharacterized protein n=1 Tax=Rhizobium leguminosarum TaxID=384 RepID=A0A179BIT9_RHILE|nr:hypothetical protein A4U53_27800 [Rhizobium leguminosarum]